MIEHGRTMDAFKELTNHFPEVVHVRSVSFRNTLTPLECYFSHTLSMFYRSDREERYVRSSRIRAYPFIKLFKRIRPNKW
jgi:hypothetical protein